MDADLRFTYISDRVIDVTGVPPEFHIGKTREELSSESLNTEKWRSLSADIEERKPIRNFQYARKTPDGGSQYITISGAPFFDDADRFLGYRRIGTDISKQKSVEDELARSKERLQAINDTVPAGIIVIDISDGQVTYANGEAARILGDNVGKLFGPDWNDVYFSPKAREDIMVRFSAGEAIKNRQLCLKRPDGELVWVLASITGVPTDDESLLLFSFTDITGQVKADTVNARLGRIVEHSINEIYVFDADTLQFTQVNEGARGNLGYVSDELERLTPVDILPQFTREQFSDFIKPLRDGSQSRIVFETEHRRKDGSHYGVEVFLQVFPEEVPPVFVAIALDITERKLKEIALQEAQMELQARVLDLDDARHRIEQEAAKQVDLAEDLAEARDAAEAANRTKSEFLASMSHEIRTPMTGVMGFADLLLEDALPPASKEKVYRIKDATRSLLTIINDILDVSKMEAGKLDLEYMDVHLPTIVEDVLALFREKRSGNRSKAVDVSCDLSDDFPVGVNCDPTRLRQILVNLVGNAVKFTDRGDVTVRGTLVPSDDGATFIRISIQDSGIGMKPETIENLFTDFTQADASITRRFEGTGLGLSICRRLVKMMGGDIGAESEFGEGSTFWFTLPYVAAASDMPDDLYRAPRDDITYKASQPLHILVAEDNNLNQTIILAMVSDFGHTCQIVENGARAVETHAEGDFDLILMDVRMPELSGPDATRKIRQMDGEGRKIPIIALTADAMEEHKVGYLDAGMDAVVTKPIARAELALTINAVMGAEIHVPAQSDAPTETAAALPPGGADVRDDEQIDAAVADFLKQIGDVS